MSLLKSNLTFDYTTDNKFLFFNRTKTGQLAYNYTGGTFTISNPLEVQTDFRNQFLVFNRAQGNSGCGCSGTSSNGSLAYNYSGSSTGVTTLNLTINDELNKLHEQPLG